MMQIKAALTALRNIRGLPVMQDLQKPGAAVDLFDCLQCWFGFQVMSLKNSCYICFYLCSLWYCLI